jgi:class 3 adenylate cyclase
MFEDRDLKNGESRLWRLIAERARTGSDVAEIDRRIWELFGEKWAVLFTDLAGFSVRTEAFGITHFLQIIFHQRQVLYPLVDEMGGFLVKAEADSMLLLHRDPAAALHLAIDMQRACAAANDRLVAEERLYLCVGLGYGQLLRIGDSDVWGAEVNAASKLGEDTADAEEILVTSSFAAAVPDPGSLRYEDIDEAAAGSERNYKVVGWQ